MALSEGGGTWLIHSEGDGDVGFSSTGGVEALAAQCMHRGCMCRWIYGVLKGNVSLFLCLNDEKSSAQHRFSNNASLALLQMN